MLNISILFIIFELDFVIYHILIFLVIDNTFLELILHGQYFPNFIIAKKFPLYPLKIDQGQPKQQLDLKSSFSYIIKILVMKILQSRNDSFQKGVKVMYKITSIRPLRW